VLIYWRLRGDIEKPSKQSFLKLSLTAIGTSIDAMAVGVGLAFIDVNIWIAAGLIGLATTFMVTLGVMVGRAVSSVLGHRAEIFGGFTLIGVGVWILSSHL
jgi:putative Mn2+ efflux pump MntP